MPGHTGEPGGRPPNYLSGGSSGAQGSSQIRVLMNNNTESTYPTIYKLRVVSFDVVDENEDGVNEPGEHLLVKNIRVENTGKLRSNFSEYGVLIASTVAQVVCHPQARQRFEFLSTELIGSTRSSVSPYVCQRPSQSVQLWTYRVSSEHSSCKRGPPGRQGNFYDLQMKSS